MWRSRNPRGRALLALTWLAIVLLAACGNAGSSGNPNGQEVAGGDAGRGKAAIKAYGCGTCHIIPGISAANGLVGPPLIKFSRRGYIAGELTNTPDNLTRWIMDPQAVEPGTVMPNMGVNAADARDIAAYLYTLK